MSNTHTAWPVRADVEQKLAMAGITPRAAMDNNYVEDIVDAVVSKLEQYTKRQFIAGSAGEERFFDGSGTGQQEVDPFVTFTNVAIYGYIGYLGMNFSSIITAQQAQYPKTLLDIARGSLPAFGRIWLTEFPVGRRNIGVTGTWGYGQYIPTAVWEAVRGEVAAVIGAESAYNPNGRIRKWMELDTLEDRDLALPGEYLGWHQKYKDVCRAFRKPLQTHLNKTMRRMR